MKDMSSIILSLFKRKGGEGKLTKVIDNSSRNQFTDLLVNLNEKEKALILYYKDSFNWCLLSEATISMNSHGVVSYISYSDLIDVKLAIKEEFKAGIINKQEFTKLIVRNKANKEYLLELEKGLPYQGIYQVLDYISKSTSFH